MDEKVLLSKVDSKLQSCTHISGISNVNVQLALSTGKTCLSINRTFQCKFFVLLDMMNLIPIDSIY